MFNVERGYPIKKGLISPLILLLKVQNIGIKDIFEFFMMVLNYRSAVLKP